MQPGFVLIAKISPNTSLSLSKCLCGLLYLLTLFVAHWKELVYAIFGFKFDINKGFCDIYWWGEIPLCHLDGGLWSSNPPRTQDPTSPRTSRTISGCCCLGNTQICGIPVNAVVRAVEEARPIRTETNFVRKYSVIQFQDLIPCAHGLRLFFGISATGSVPNSANHLGTVFHPNHVPRKRHAWFWLPFVQHTHVQRGCQFLPHSWRLLNRLDFIFCF